MSNVRKHLFKTINLVVVEIQKLRWRLFHCLEILVLSWMDVFCVVKSDAVLVNFLETWQKKTTFLKEQLFSLSAMFQNYILRRAQLTSRIQAHAVRTAYNKCGSKIGLN